MSDLPTPITREERYLNGIAQGDTSDLPTPVGREEKYLDYIARNGGGGGTTNYNALDNKPQIAGTTLQGDKSLADLGIASAEALGNKVDKVEGKGLSTNDYSDTEKGKVADNASAIEAIENVTGAKNVAPYPYVDTTKTDANVIYTDIGDGTITVSGTANALTGFGLYDLNAKKVSDIFPEAGDYIITYKDKDDVFPVGVSATLYIQNSYVNVTIPENGLSVTITDAMMSSKLGMWFSIQSGTAISGTITIKPMIRPAGTDSTYVPYAMTNKELTDRALTYIDISIPAQTINSNSTYSFDPTTIPTGYRPIAWSYSSDYGFSIGAFFTIDEMGEGGYRCYVYNPHSSNIQIRGHLKVACCKYY